MKHEKLKRAVIKEEFVVLTGNYILALILNQFLYWSERVSDLANLIEEENIRSKKTGDNEIYENESFEHGWIYKSADQLNEELMTGFSHTTMNSYIKKLIDMGYLHRRRNPSHHWDRTWQYRIDIETISLGLENIGYSLQGYFNAKSKNLQCKVKNVAIDSKNPAIKSQETCNQKSENLQAIPEILSETTSETTSKIEERDVKKSEKKPSLPKKDVESKDEIYYPTEKEWIDYYYEYAKEFYNGKFKVNEIIAQSLAKKDYNYWNKTAKWTRGSARKKQPVKDWKGTCRNAVLSANIRLRGHVSYNKKNNVYRDRDENGEIIDNGNIF